MTSTMHLDDLLESIANMEIDHDPSTLIFRIIFYVIFL